MKALTKNCFLALLCLFGSETYAQVASPPATGGPENAPAPVVVYGELLGYEEGDSITVKFQEYLFDETSKVPAPTIIKPEWEDGGVFKGVHPGIGKIFRLSTPPFQSPGYLSIRNGRTGYLDHYLIEPGDSIKISINKLNFTLSFSGPAAEKFNLQRALDQQVATFFGNGSRKANLLVSQKLTLEQEETLKATQAAFGREVKAILSFEQALEAMKVDIKRLDATMIRTITKSYSPVVPEKFLELVETEYLSRMRLPLISTFYRHYFRVMKQSGNSPLAKEYEKFYGDHLRSMEDLSAYVAGMEQSYSYLDLMAQLMKIKAKIKGKTAPELISAIPHTQLREALLTRYFLEKRNLVIAGPEALGDLLTSIGQEPYRSILSELYYRNSSGEKLEPFTFHDLQGKPRKLEEFSDKVILMDFWFSGCKACINMNTDILQKLAERYAGREDFIMLSISSDRKEELWKRSHHSGKYAPESSVHLNTGADGGQHPFLKHYNIHLYPHLMLVGKKGKLIQSGMYKPTYESVAELVERALDKQPKL
ncbi:TlpA family protein disulfide reductase [Echinicola shivajiensis]|uniref:TlpA family protein disulfide reductase n=1 Tax=Echinicola shivajiensis TaxID=1035916 RepID=UPI001BFC6B2E|nr:TlpA disulfide reductase family protein [Echinicola shivajiensis]